MSTQLDFKPSTRSGPFSDRLKQRGYKIEDAWIDGKLLIRIISPQGVVWLTGANMSYPFTSHEIYRISSDKSAMYQLAESQQIRVPKTIKLTDPRDQKLVDFLHEVQTVVIKPLDSYQSRGVTCDITEPSQLESAAQKALEHSGTFLAQEQIRAEEYRFTVLDNKVASVLRRERPQLVGDGSHTIAELITEENQQRAALDLSYITYPQLDSRLIDPALLVSDEVLAIGERRIIGGSTMISKGASAYELLDETHQTLKDIALHIASYLGSPLLVIDLFIEDHTKSLEQTPYWFNEINAAPSLRMYTAARNRPSPHIADAVVELFDAYLHA